MTTRRTTNATANGIAVAEGPWPKTAHDGRPKAVVGDKLTLAQLCDELQIARSTFYDWRAKVERRGASNCPTAISGSAAQISSVG